MNIRKKMAKGALWLFLEKGGQQVSSFVVFAIIARLIGPEEYGLVALCGIFLSLAVNVVNGLVDAIISMHIKDDQRLSTLTWIVTGTGACISLGTYMLAEPFAQMMGSEKLAPLLQCFSIIPVLLSMTSVPTALVTEAMNFKVFAIRTFVATLVGGVVGVLMALDGYGAYALLGQQIVLYIVMNLIIWPSCGWFPKVMFKLEGMREVLKLGMGQTSSSMVLFAEGQAPRFFLGLFFDPIIVGYYAFAQRMAGALQDGLVSPLLAVIYPAFSRIKDDFKEQKKILNQFILLLGNFMFPAVAGAIVTAPLYVPLLFGDKWVPAIPLLSLFLLMVIPASLNVALRNYLKSHKLILSFLCYQSVFVFAVLGACGSSFFVGVNGFIGIYTALTVAATIAYTYLVQKKTTVSLWRSYARLWSAVIAAGTMYIAVFYYIEQTDVNDPTITNFITSITIGILLYLSTVLILNFQRTKPFLQKLGRK